MDEANNNNDDGPRAPPNTAANNNNAAAKKIDYDQKPYLVKVTYTTNDDGVTVEAEVMVCAICNHVALQSLAGFVATLGPLRNGGAIWRLAVGNNNNGNY